MTTKSEPVRHIIVIVPDGEFCSPVPAEMLCLTGDVVHFQNLVGGGVVIAFDSPELFGTPNLKLDPEQTRSLPVIGTAVGCFSYQTFLERSQGQSNKTLKPRIIVYRPFA